MQSTASSRDKDRQRQRQRQKTKDKKDKEHCTYQTGVRKGGGAGEQLEQQHAHRPVVDGLGVAPREHHLRGDVLRSAAQLNTPAQSARTKTRGMIHITKLLLFFF
jgi:hypothetical protein